jgi:hypothetical protein
LAHRSINGHYPNMGLERTPVSVNRLHCVECGRVSREDDHDWTARLTIDDDVVVYCPECDEREFSADGD